jgi:hypothetical protein
MFERQIRECAEWMAQLAQAFGRMLGDEVMYVQMRRGDFRKGIDRTQRRLQATRRAKVPGGTATGGPAAFLAVDRGLQGRSRQGR